MKSYVGLRRPNNRWFLKLDFSKTYDKMPWSFLFHVMNAMNINEHFTRWVKLLFENASVIVDLNGKSGNNFQIKREVR